MSFQITHIATGVSTTVSEAPQWVAGVWECGDHRFTDAAGTAYLPAPVYPTLKAMQFYLAFAPAERIKLKTSTDPVVQEFWATFQLAVQTDTDVHMELASNRAAIAYLAVPTTATPPGPGILTAARVPQVLAGIPQ